MKIENRKVIKTIRIAEARRLRGAFVIAVFRPFPWSFEVLLRKMRCYDTVSSLVTI